MAIISDLDGGYCNPIDDAGFILHLTDRELIALAEVLEGLPPDPHSPDPGPRSSLQAKVRRLEALRLERLRIAGTGRRTLPGLLLFDEPEG